MISKKSMTLLTFILVATFTYLIKGDKSTELIKDTSKSLIIQDISTGIPVVIQQKTSSQSKLKEQSWTIVDKPKGSKAVFNSKSFLPDVDGEYTIKRIDASGVILFPEESIHLKAKTKNTPPTSNAGKDQIGYIEDTLTLDGSKSFDTDWIFLKYKWSVSKKPPKSKVTLEKDNNVKPSFKADTVGKYILCLEVSDPESSHHDEMIITLSSKKTSENKTPIADAGRDVTVKVDTIVRLDGSKSYDIDGGIEKFDWFISKKPKDSTAFIVGDTLVLASIIVDVEGEYVVSLKVSDAETESEISRIKLKVTSESSDTVADAGDDQNIKLNSSVYLDGSKSVGETEEIVYKWYFVSIPEGSQAMIAKADSVNPEFECDKKGTYVVGLVISDSQKESKEDTVAVVVDNSKNSSPIAKIVGLNTYVKNRTNLILDGSLSTDPEKDELIYRWFFKNKPSTGNTEILNSTSPRATLSGLVTAYYMIGLEVSDGDKTDTTEGWVMVNPSISITEKPSSDAGYNQKAFITSEVKLRGSGKSNSYIKKLNYNWSFKKKPYGSKATLAKGKDASFKADILGEYLVELETSVGKIKSNKDVVKITVVPLEIKLKWNPPKKKKGKKAVTGYKVYFKHNNEEKEKKIGLVSSYILPKLELNQTYFIKLAACVESGQCTKPTGELMFETKNKEIRND